MLHFENALVIWMVFSCASSADAGTLTCKRMIALPAKFLAMPNQGQKAVNPTNGNQHRIKHMSHEVSVSISSQPTILGAPLPVSMKIVNEAAQPVSIFLPYPSPNNLSFRGASADCAEQKPVESDPIERAAPTTIEAKGEYTRTYFLNRYLRLKKVGTCEVFYELRILVATGVRETPPKSEIFTGGFDVELLPAAPEQINKELAQYGAQLRSPNSQLKMEAAEALQFIESPAVVPFLISMLQIDGLEVIALRALGHHRSPNSRSAIVSMLGHPDSAVVSAALEQIDKLALPVPRQDVQQLLSSENPRIQWVALGWLAARPSRDDLPLVRPLINSHNGPLRERASEYVIRLETLK